MAIWIAQGYRTISYKAATVLARHSSFDILANMDATVYDQIRSVSRNGEKAVPDHETGLLRRSGQKQALKRNQVADYINRYLDPSITPVYTSHTR